MELVAGTIPPDTLPLTVKCRGRRPNGRTCGTVIATLIKGTPVVRYGGRETVDPRSTSCPHCGTVRTFAGGVREELLAARGVRARNGDRTAEPAA